MSRRAASTFLSVASLAACALAATARDAAACAVHCSTDATLTTIGNERPARHRVRLTLDERFAGRDLGVGAAASRTFSLRSALAVTWSPTDRLTIGALLPLVSVWSRAPGQDPGLPWRSGTGLGDLEVSVRGVVWRDRGALPSHLVSALVGLKTPTGPRALDDTGYPLPEDDQPGSGSWDPFGGLAYSWFHDPVAIFVSAQYRYTTPGRREYRRGMGVFGSAGVQYQPHRVVALGLATDVRWTAADRFGDGALASDTGGALVALTPSILIAPLREGRRGLAIRLAGQIPVLNRLAGTQRETPAVLLALLADLN